MGRMFACVFLLVGLLPTSSFSGSQEKRALVPPPKIVPKVAVDPITLKLNGLAKKFPNTRLLKRFKGKGSVRFLFEHFEQPLKITAHDNGEFEVRLTREFDANDIDSIADEHPELLKYTTAFPQSTANNSTIKLKIETEATYRLANEHEFESSHPGLCDIYREFRTAPLRPINPDLVQQVAVGAF